ncbi:hypothetical protein KAH55_06225, partial [bacterium]|nr:hypothetical protein [bacterium]
SLIGADPQIHISFRLPMMGPIEAGHEDFAVFSQPELGPGTYVVNSNISFIDLHYFMPFNSRLRVFFFRDGIQGINQQQKEADE